jgi:YegS/Rv2252/BmrU family lipid kinase
MPENAGIYPFMVNMYKNLKGQILMDNYGRKEILFILNPAAGKKSVSGLYAETLFEAFPGNEYILDSHLTAKKGDASHFVRQYGEGKDIIVCAGGDGTFNETISGVVAASLKTPVGYIPSGTTNDVAKTLYIPANFSQAAAIIRQGISMPMDIGIFNGVLPFTYIASFGSFTEASYLTPQWAKNTLGYAAYLMGGIKNLNSIHPYGLSVSSGDISESGKFIFGAVLNSTSAGGLLRFSNSEVNLNDGLFEVLLIRYPKGPLAFTHILDCLRRQKMDEQHFLYIHAEQAQFVFADDVAWTVDGEFAGQFKSVNVNVMKSAFNVIIKKTDGIGATC